MMKTLLSILLLISLSFGVKAQTASRLLNGQAKPYKLLHPDNFLYVDTLSGGEFRIWAVKKDSMTVTPVMMKWITDTLNNRATAYYKTSNPSSYISGINNAMVLAALGYTPYNASNPNGYISSFTETDPVWLAQKASYSTKAVADGLYKPIGYVPAWTDVTGKPSFATVATSGAYADLTGKPTFKRQETYAGTTNASGLYTVTYGTAFPSTPNVQFQIGTGGNNKETILLTASSTTGFTCYVQLRADVLGLLPSYSNVSGRNVQVLVTES